MGVAPWLVGIAAVGAAMAAAARADGRREAHLRTQVALDVAKTEYPIVYESGQHTVMLWDKTFSVGPRRREIPFESVFCISTRPLGEGYLWRIHVNAGDARVLELPSNRQTDLAVHVLARKAAVELLSPGS